MKNLTCFLCLAILLAACKSSAPFPLNQEWKLVELKNKPVPAQVKATLTFEPTGKRYGGKNSCNTYSGAYTLTGSSLTFGPAIATKMYCAEVADWETAFMNMLPTVDNYVYRDNQLRLLTGTKIVAVFE